MVTLFIGKIMEGKTGFHLLHLLRLIRWPNLLIVLLTQVLIMYLIIGRIFAMSGTTPALGVLPFMVLVFTTVLIAAGGYIINDYFDIHTDRINKPDEMIVGKYLSRRKAIKLHIIISSIAIVAGFSLAFAAGSFRLGILFPLLITLLWFYSERYKRTILAGNLAVALLSAMVVLVVWLFEFFALRSDPDRFMMVYTMLGLVNRIVFTYALFAFFLTLTREIIKDAEDVEGDEGAGCRTLPVVYGIHRATLLAGALLLITCIMVLAACFYLYMHAMVISSAFFVLLVGVPLIYTLFRVFKARQKKDFSTISRLLKLIMLAGVSGLVVLSLSL